MVLLAVAVACYHVYRVNDERNWVDTFGVVGPGTIRRRVDKPAAVFHALPCRVPYSNNTLTSVTYTQTQQFSSDFLCFCAWRDMVSRQSSGWLFSWNFRMALHHCVSSTFPGWRHQSFAEKRTLSVCCSAIVWFDLLASVHKPDVNTFSTRQ